MDWKDVLYNECTQEEINEIGMDAGIKLTQP